MTLGKRLLTDPGSIGGAGVVCKRLSFPADLKCVSVSENL